MQERDQWADAAIKTWNRLKAPGDPLIAAKHLLTYKGPCIVPPFFER